MITKLDTEMFHHEYRKHIYFGVTKSKVKATRHKRTVPVWFLHSCECWLLLFNYTLFFVYLVCHLLMKPISSLQPICTDWGTYDDRDL